MAWGAARRAEELDDLVEGRATGADADRYAELLEVVGALRSVPDVTARPEFVADLRQRLLAEAETALAPVDLDRLRLPARRPARERRIAALVGAVAIAGATTSIAVAAQSALPGESLYPVKRAIERVHTEISVGDEAKGRTLLADASDRLDEVDALAQRDGLADDQRIEQTLAAFSDQSAEASDLLLSDYQQHGDAEAVATLRDFASSSLGRLEQLEPLVPPEAHDELVRAASLLTSIDSEAGQQCPACGGTPITSIPSTLAAARIVLPPLPALALGLDQGAHPASPGSPGPHARHPGQATGGDDGGPEGSPQLPTVDSDELPPGSVSDPVSGSGPVTGGASDPITDLTNAVTGGLTGSGPTGTKGGGSTVHDTVKGTVKGTVDAVDGTVQGTVDGLSQVLEGTVGSVLGGSKQQP